MSCLVLHLSTAPNLPIAELLTNFQLTLSTELHLNEKSLNSSFAVNLAGSSFNLYSQQASKKPKDIESCAGLAIELSNTFYVKFSSASVYSKVFKLRYLHVTCYIHSPRLML